MRRFHVPRGTAPGGDLLRHSPRIAAVLPGRALRAGAGCAHRAPGTHTVQFLTNAFALGMGSYLSLYTLRDAAAAVATWLRLREPRDVLFFEALLNDGVRIAWGEIALSACVAV